MRSNDKPLNEILKELVNTKQFKQKILLKRIEKIWQDEMGETITRYTDQIYLRKNTLVINVSSSVMRHQLNIGKEQIMKKVNTALGENFVKEVLVY